MPYIRKEEVQAIRQALKANPKLKEFKLSVVCRHHCSVTVAIMKGPDLGTTKEYINKYHYKNQVEFPKLVEVIEAIQDTILTAHPQRTVSEDGDYGSIPNYYDITLGKWDQEYQVVA